MDAEQTRMLATVLHICSDRILQARTAVLRGHSAKARYLVQDVIDSMDKIHRALMIEIHDHRELN